MDKFLISFNFSKRQRTLIIINNNQRPKKKNSNNVEVKRNKMKKLWMMTRIMLNLLKGLKYCRKKIVCSLYVSYVCVELDWTLPNTAIVWLYRIILIKILKGCLKNGKSAMDKTRWWWLRKQNSMYSYDMIWQHQQHQHRKNVC